MISRWWKDIKQWQKYGLTGGIVYTTFAFWWTYKGFDLICDFLYPVQTSFQCLPLILVLFPSVFVLEGIGDIIKIIDKDWTSQTSLYHSTFLNWLFGVIVFFIQGFLMGVLVYSIVQKIKKK